MIREENQLKHDLIEAKIALYHEMSNLYNHGAQVLSLHHRIIDIETEMAKLKVSQEGTQA